MSENAELRINYSNRFFKIKESLRDQVSKNNTIVLTPKTCPPSNVTMKPGIYKVNNLVESGINVINVLVSVLQVMRI